MNPKTKLIVFGIGGLLVFLVIIFAVFVLKYQPPSVQDADNFQRESVQESGLTSEPEAATTQFPNGVPDTAALPDTNAVPPTGKSTCADSDPKNDIYTKGSVTTSEGGQKTVYDECIGSTGERIWEMGCYELPKGSGNYVKGQAWRDCPNGCYDGRCLKEGEVSTAPPATKLHLLSPEHEDLLCVGEEYVIQWEGPKELSTVALSVSRRPGGETYSLGDFPATFKSNAPGKGKYLWKVSTPGGVGDVSDGFFISIVGKYPKSMNKPDEVSVVRFYIIYCEHMHTGPL